MITIRCTCGESYQADEAHIGKNIRCRCGKVLKILAPSVVSASQKHTTGATSSPKSAVASTQIQNPRRRFGYLAVAFIAVMIIWSLWRVYQPTSGKTVSPSNLPTTPGPASILCSSEDIYRPTSGAELGGDYRGGHSWMRISNGTNYDAAAVLIDASTNRPRRSIFIRKGEFGLISQVPAGVYQLRFQIGSSWLKTKHFCEPVGTSEFDRSLNFEDSEGIAYSTFKITLNPVPLGTARTHPLPDSAFELP